MVWVDVYGAPNRHMRFLLADCTHLHHVFCSQRRANCTDCRHVSLDYNILKLLQKGGYREPLLQCCSPHALRSQELHSVSMPFVDGIDG